MAALCAYLQLTRERERDIYSSVANAKASNYTTNAFKIFDFIHQDRFNNFQIKTFTVLLKFKQQQKVTSIERCAYQKDK